MVPSEETSPSSAKQQTEAKVRDAAALVLLSLRASYTNKILLVRLAQSN